MRIFISAGEPSGDVHGSNLVRAIHGAQPGDVECVGFGGPRMAQAGAKLLYPLTDLAVMWFSRVLANAGTFLSLLSQADRFFAHHRPDVVVLIDYPGFHWWLARRAHYHGIPVVYFVPPQLWAWAGWRSKKMKRWVDHVLCSLPFEQPWYGERGISAEYVGHPFFDEVPSQKLDEKFLARLRGPGSPIIGILPGSRTQEIEKNFSTLCEAASLIYASRPDVRFHVACFSKKHQEKIDEILRRQAAMPVETHVDRTPEIIEASHSCMTVSGSVSLELLHREKPATVLYRLGKWHAKLARKVMTSRYFTLVNVLADRELFPEFGGHENYAKDLSDWILRWLDDRFAYDVRVRDLRRLKTQVAQPGACQRAAERILQVANQKHLRATA